MTYIPALTSAMPAGSELLPHHWYRPINDSAYTTLVAGDVSVLKDVGTQTTFNLVQSTASLRFTHGVDTTTGRDYMVSSDGSHVMHDGTGTVADWKYLHDGSESTVAMIVQVDAQTGANWALSTNDTGNPANAGFRVRINGTVGTDFQTDTGSSTAALAFRIGTAINHANGTKLHVVIRQRYLAAAGNTQQGDLIASTIHINGVCHEIAHERINAFGTGNPNNVLGIGNVFGSSSGLVGRYYDIMVWHRWLGESEIWKMERRAKNDFGVAL